MLKLTAVALVGYLLGSIPAGYLVGRRTGIDIRKAGSGNIGATNVTRTLGKRYGYLVFLVDFTKGFLAVKISTLFVRDADIDPELFGIVAALFCVLGHTFPIWLGFKGGKGLPHRAGRCSA